MRLGRTLLALLYKDVLVELREVHHVLSVVLFGLMLMLLFSFALSVDPDVARRIAAGLYWLAIFFTAILTLEHSFRREMVAGQWDGLLLTGVDPRLLFVGKVLAHLLLLFLVGATLLLPMAVLFDVSLSWRLVSVLALGTLGIAGVGTFYAGLTARVREGQVLLPLLLFPMMVPLLLAAVHATQFAMSHDVFGQQIAWLRLLAVYDLVLGVGALLCAGPLFESA